MEKRKILLPVAILALLISGCTVKKRSQTESNSNSQGSSTPQTSESSSSGGSQGGGSQGGTSESQGGTSQDSQESQPGSESQPGGSESTVPVGSGYFIKLGEGQPLEFVTEADLDADVENELKNYKLQVNGVTAGEAIEFSTSAGVINHNIGPNDTCNADRTGSEEDGWSFTIHNSVEGNVDIYFKLYDYEDVVMRDGQVHGYSFWISGREGGSVDPDPTEPEQYALIIKGESQSKAKLVTNSGNENEWTNEQPLVLAENDQLAFCLGGDDWRKFDQLKDETPDLATNFERVNAEGDPSDGNIKVKAAGAGTYNVYIVKANEGKTIYLAKTNTPEPPDPAAVYSYKLGEADAVEMEEVTTPDTGYSKQYKKDGVALAKDAVLQILADDEPLEFTKDSEDALNKCNLYKDGSAWKVHNDAASASIILKLDGDNHWRIWVTGYAADPEAQFDVTFNITENAGEGKAMYVAGDFTGWASGALKMEAGEGNAWSLSIKLEAGEYEYKFVKADATAGVGEGAVWESDPNRELTVTNAAVIINATWENAGGGDPDPDPAVPAHTLRVFGESPVNHALTGKNENTEYYIENLALAQNDVFKIKMSSDDSDWRGFGDVKTVGTGSAHANFADDGTDDHNIKCIVAGNYDIYVGVAADADGDNVGKSIWIAVHSEGGDPDPDPDPAVPAHTLRVFGESPVNHALVENGEGEYKLLNLELALNDVFKIKMSSDDSDWRGYDQFKTVGAGSAHANFADDGTDDHNVKCLVAGHYDFYIGVAADPDGDNAGKSIWVAEHPEPVDRTGWKAVVNGVDQAVSNNTENENEIYIKDVELAVGDTIIFQNADGSVKQGFAQLKEVAGNGSAHFEAGTNGELKALDAGTYDFYVDLSLEKGIWVAKQVDPSTLVTVTFTVNFDTYANGDIYLAGIKGWDRNDNTKMTWTNGNNWTYTVELEIGQTYEFKLVWKKGDSTEQWEKDGDNRSYTAKADETAVNLSWGSY